LKDTHHATHCDVATAAAHRRGKHIITRSIATRRSQRCALAISESVLTFHCHIQDKWVDTYSIVAGSACRRVCVEIRANPRAASRRCCWTLDIRSLGLYYAP